MFHGPGVIALGVIALFVYVLSSAQYVSFVNNTHAYALAFLWTILKNELRAVTAVSCSNTWCYFRLYMSVWDIRPLHGVDANAEVISIWGTGQVLKKSTTTTPLRARSSRQQVHAQWQYKTLSTKYTSPSIKASSPCIHVFSLPCSFVLFADDEPEDRRPSPVGDDPESEVVLIHTYIELVYSQVRTEWRSKREIFLLKMFLAPVHETPYLSMILTIHGSTKSIPTRAQNYVSKLNGTVILANHPFQTPHWLQQAH